MIREGIEIMTLQKFKWGKKRIEEKGQGKNYGYLRIVPMKYMKSVVFIVIKKK